MPLPLMNISVLKAKEAESAIVATSANEVLLENIKDSDGHNRFIEGTISIGQNYQEYMNMDNIYGKWSLSGTHLLIVLSGEFKAGEVGAVILDNRLATLDSLPAWIFDKVKNVFGTDSYLEGKRAEVANFNAGIATTLSFDLRKYGGAIRIGLPNNFTLTNKAYFRVSFDLLIDND